MFIRQILGRATFEQDHLYGRKWFYEGELDQNDNFCGYGKISTLDTLGICSYEGTWLNNEKHGIGKTSISIFIVIFSSKVYQAKL